VILRAAWRAVALAFALAMVIAGYWGRRLRGRMTLERRAHWLQFAGRTVLASLGVKVCVQGSPPQRGLVVSNHLSYLDILILSSAMPCFFVSKAEIGSWPYFGRAARSGGTIFLVRTSRASATEAAKEIGERLKLPVPILLFPEGTSTDGSRVLRFHTWLFEPAVAARAPVTAAAVRYAFNGRGQERDLCWFDDTLFLPHLLKVLGTPAFTAEVTFAEPRLYPDRRAAAEATYTEVSSMREQAEHGSSVAV
jgi:1-acyl-sn-glycerol-3-phosphate acyltransferase